MPHHLPLETHTTPRQRTRSFSVLLGAGGVLVVFAFVGTAQRLTAARASPPVETSAAPTVQVATATAAPSEHRLVLPGTLRAWQNTPLYARAEGYLTRLHADIGDEVRAGQVLAEVDTPELDRELAAARAQAAQSQARLALAESTDRRYRMLLAQRSVSELEADQAATAAQAGRADVDLARANVQRLEERARFKRVTAPFDGRITQRIAEPGVLVTPTTSLFQLAATDRLRVRIQVPQSHMRSVRPGLEAQLTVQEYPARIFTGRVTRTSGSLDEARTMTAEVELSNVEDHLMPGTYSQVSIVARAAVPTVLIPANALIVNHQGTQVVLVEPAGTVQLRAVRIGRNLGAQVEVLEGISAGARLILNPDDTLRSGARVTTAPADGTVRASATTSEGGHSG